MCHPAVFLSHSYLQDRSLRNYIFLGRAGGGLSIALVRLPSQNWVCKGALPVPVCVLMAKLSQRRGSAYIALPFRRAFVLKIPLGSPKLKVGVMQVGVTSLRPLFNELLEEV